MPIDAARVERLLDVIADASQGNFGTRIPVEDVEDELLEIEVGINFLLDELTIHYEQNQRQQDELLDQARRIAEQSQALVAVLSTPIIVLWPGVLALPLIGHFDLERATKVTSTLLDRVARERASHVILDLTGVEDIGNKTIDALMRMTRAMGMLGVRCLLTGMQPHSAQQIVELDLDLGDARPLARVSDALVQVLSEKGALT